MKVILTENVKSLGNVGEIVNVSPGYARNFLYPRSLAILADEKNKKSLADKQKMLAKKVSEQKGAAEEVAKKLNGLTVTLTKKIGGSGKLFGSVTNTELASELEKQGIEVERRQIIIETPIKSAGTFEVKAKIFQGVSAEFKVQIEADAKYAEELKAKAAALAEKKAKDEAKKKAEEEEAKKEAEEAEETAE